jgi:hypothetical protein
VPPPDCSSAPDRVSRCLPDAETVAESNGEGSASERVGDDLCGDWDTLCLSVMSPASECRQQGLYRFRGFGGKL